jgi:predicted DNA-binding transcriptional regulator YafY
LIKTKSLHPSQQLISENNADGSCVFSINVVHNKELYSVLMSYGPGIKVLSPQKVVYYIRKLLRLTTANYEAES